MRMYNFEILNTLFDVIAFHCKRIDRNLLEYFLHLIHFKMHVEGNDFLNHTQNVTHYQMKYDLNLLNYKNKYELRTCRIDIIYVYYL